MRVKCQYTMVIMYLEYKTTIEVRMEVWNIKRQYKNITCEQINLMNKDQTVIKTANKIANK